MTKSVLLSTIVVASIGIAGHASATFQIDPTPGGAKLFLVKGKDISKGSGNVGSHSGPMVNIAVMGNADFADGFAEITPVKGSLLTSITFTPVDANGFSDFSFRGQDLTADNTITVTVQDNQGGPPQTFTFPEAKADDDFARVGIYSTDGETIQSIIVSDPAGFKEFKQIEFSAAGTVPEPATWALMLVGVGALGGVLRRRVNASATPA